MCIYVCVYTPLLFLIIFSWHLDCFCILAVVNNAAMNIGEHVSFQTSVFLFLRSVARSGIAVSYGSSVLEF